MPVDDSDHSTKDDAPAGPLPDDLGRDFDREARCSVVVSGEPVVRSVRLMRRGNRLYFVQVSVAHELVAVADGFLASLRVRAVE